MQVSHRFASCSLLFTLCQIGILSSHLSSHLSSLRTCEHRCLVVILDKCICHHCSRCSSLRIRLTVYSCMLTRNSRRTHCRTHCCSRQADYSPGAVVRRASLAMVSSTIFGILVTCRCSTRRRSKWWRAGASMFLRWCLRL